MGTQIIILILWIEICFTDHELGLIELKEDRLCISGGWRRRRSFFHGMNHCDCLTVLLCFSLSCTPVFMALFVSLLYAV